MEAGRKPQEVPSVPRDTRLLLMIVVIALLLLWVLARVRFPDRPPTPNPVPPVLAQLAPPSPLDEMVSVVAGLQTRLDPLLVPVSLRPDAPPPTSVTALRFRGDLGLFVSAQRPAVQAVDHAPVAQVVWDPASKLAVVRVAAGGSAELSTWTPRRLGSPRVLVVVDTSGGSITMRPVFVSSLVERTNAIWSGIVWTLPGGVDPAAGSFLFTVDGAWVGVVMETPDGHEIVPAQTVAALAERLAEEGPRQQGGLGIEVQPLTASLTAATGAAAGGVIVVWVDANGPAAGRLEPGDTVEAVNGDHLSGLEEWIARTARLQPNASIVLRVRWREEVRDVTLTARGEQPESANRALGLMLRTLAKTGAAVVRVDPGSAAYAAGLEPGDVLILVGDRTAPTAAQALHAFADAPRGRPILVGVTRGERHLMVAILRTW